MEQTEVRRAQVAELIAVMATAVESDGGELRLVDVDTCAGVVSVELSGACVSCAASSVTMKAGVERILRERLDWVTEVRGSLDDEMDPLVASELGRGAYRKL